MAKKPPELYILKNNAKFRLDLDSMLCLPVNVYWKDAEGNGLGCNDLNAQACLIKSTDEWIGMKSTDFLPQAPAKLIDAIDRYVMINKEEKSLIEYLVASDGTFTSWLSTKLPMYNQDGKVVGLFGTATKIENNILHETKKQLSKLDIAVHDLTFVHAVQNPKIQSCIESLSLRQKEYLYYLLQGMQDKVISEMMNISVRTAETYINIIKVKLGCRTRDQVIVKILNPFVDLDVKS